MGDFKVGQACALFSTIYAWVRKQFSGITVFGVLFLVYSSFPDFASRNEYWIGKISKLDPKSLIAMDQFITSGGGRILLLAIGLLIIGLDHRAQLRKHLVSKTSTASAALEKRAERRKPQLSVVQSCIKTCYDKDHDILTERCAAGGPGNTFIFTVTNPAPSVDVCELRAEIAWNGIGKFGQPHFCPAAWVDEKCGMVDIPVGYSKKLVLASWSGVKVDEGIHFYGYSNCRVNADDKNRLCSELIPIMGSFVLKLIGDGGTMLWESREIPWKQSPNTGFWPWIGEV